MRAFKFLAVIAVLFLSTAVSNADTLKEVQKRGKLNCIVSSGLAGFASPDEKGNWTGFDVDFCRAVAAAVLGSGNKVKFVPSTSKTRFTLLNSAEGDILFRNTTETLSRDVDLKLTFLPVNYYDGQGFLIRKDSGVTSATQLGGASVCVQAGTTTELNLADYFRSNKMKYEPVNTETNEESIKAYTSKRCDVYTTDASALASTRAALKDPSAHMILPEIISKEPLGGAVRHGDDRWADIGKWVVNALIIAEEMGINSKNVSKMASKPGKNPSMNRFLGTEGSMGKMLGLDNKWAVRAIKAVGNYGEIFERNLGVKTPLALQRGLNASWTNGGILYAAPVR
ncbi:MAG: amino acid ABC transporter substrate-binding protein [Candidatus Dadabacteria bacterium]|nr:amino acid ABC transporter substrate-binding protein [Candidatus Dadabacteria bacterium]